MILLRQGPAHIVLLGMIKNDTEFTDGRTLTSAARCALADALRQISLDESERPQLAARILDIAKVSDDGTLRKCLGRAFGAHCTQEQLNELALQASPKTGNVEIFDGATEIAVLRESIVLPRPSYRFPLPAVAASPQG